MNVVSQNVNFYVAGIYCPASATSGAINTVSELLAPFIASEMVILGDLNLDWLTPSSDCLKLVCFDLNLVQLISESTCLNVKNPAKSTPIDLILTNNHEYLASGVCAMGPQ